MTGVTQTERVALPRAANGLLPRITLGPTASRAVSDPSQVSGRSGLRGYTARSGYPAGGCHYGQWDLLALNKAWAVPLDLLPAPAHELLSA